MEDRVELKLHIPEAPARPGDTPNFDHIAIPEAGATRKGIRRMSTWNLRIPVPVTAGST